MKYANAPKQVRHGRSLPKSVCVAEKNDLRTITGTAPPDGPRQERRMKDKKDSEMHGTMLGYRPEYRLDTFESSDGPSFTKWKEIPWDIGVAPYGHPYPRLFGGVLQTCGLL
jgi:hypothetical protein